MRFRFLFLYFLALVVCMNFTASYAGIDLTVLKNRFHQIKNAYPAYKKALRAYEACIQEHCKEEIAALEHANEQLRNTQGGSVELKKIAMIAKENAEDRFKKAVRTKCLPVQQQLKKAQRDFNIHLAVATGVLFTATVLPTIGGVVVFAKWPSIKANRAIDALMKKYDITNDPQGNTRQALLNLYELRQPGKKQQLSSEEAKAFEVNLYAMIKYIKSDVKVKKTESFISAIVDILYNYPAHPAAKRQDFMNDFGIIVEPDLK